MTRSQESPRTSPAEQPPGGIRDTLDALRQDAQAALARAERRLALVDSVAKVTADLKARGVHGKLDITAGQIVLTVDLDAAPGEAMPAARPKLVTRPEPVKAPPAPPKPAAQPAKAPKPTALEFKTGAWSKREAADALRWRDEGLTVNEIAAKLNRDPRGIGPKLSHLAKKLGDQPAAPVAQPEPGRKPGETFTPPPVEPDSGFSIDLAKATSGADRLVRMHLRALGHVAPWTPDRDLRLVRGLAAGDGLGPTAEALGIDRDECKARWNELLPEVTIDGQAQLLATLQAVAAEAAE